MEAGRGGDAVRIGFARQAVQVVIGIRRGDGCRSRLVLFMGRHRHQVAVVIVAIGRGSRLRVAGRPQLPERIVDEAAADATLSDGGKALQWTIRTGPVVSVGGQEAGNIDDEAGRSLQNRGPAAESLALGRPLRW